MDPTKALPQRYGAVQGLAALGPNVVLIFLILLSISLSISPRVYTICDFYNNLHLIHKKRA